jgi:hypothetical protein
MLRKNLRRPARFDVPVNAHGDALLAQLLRLLRPAPQGWITKASKSS